MATHSLSTRHWKPRLVRKYGSNSSCTRQDNNGARSLQECSEREILKPITQDPGISHKHGGDKHKHQGSSESCWCFSLLGSNYQRLCWQQMNIFNVDIIKFGSLADFVNELCYLKETLKIVMWAALWWN